MHLHSYLSSYIICLYLHNACRQPLPCLVEHVHAIVENEAHTTSPLLLYAARFAPRLCIEIDPLIVLGLEACIVHEDLPRCDLQHLGIAPLFDSVEAVDMLALVEHQLMICAIGRCIMLLVSAFS